MQIHYKAVAFHPDTSNLQILYYNEIRPEGVLFSIEIPRIDGAYPSGEALEAIILKHMPYDMLSSPDSSLHQHKRTPGKPQLFDLGTAFMTDDQAALFLRRPLVRLNGLSIPIDVI